MMLDFLRSGRDLAFCSASLDRGLSLSEFDASSFHSGYSRTKRLTVIFKRVLVEEMWEIDLSHRDVPSQD
jgi:hypothetical protein